MPALAADSFTASSSVLGKRIFTRSVLGWISNNTVRNCERSYSVKSALATNPSASSSVSSVGNFFFIIGIKKSIDAALAALCIVGRKFGVDVRVSQAGCPRVGLQFGDGLREGARTGACAEHAGDKATDRLAVPRVY